MPINLLLQGREVEQWAANDSAFINNVPGLKRKIEVRTVGGVTTIYKGYADFGSALDAAVWKLQRIVIDRSVEYDITEDQADSGNFTQRWIDRATATYT